MPTKWRLVCLFTELAKEEDIEDKKVADENEALDNRHLFLKNAVYQGDSHSSPYALSVSSPKIEPLDKRLMKATAH